jgi:hypothetical protein
MLLILFNLDFINKSYHRMFVILQNSQIDYIFGLLLSSLKGAKLDLRTSSTYFSFSLTLLLSDSI